MIRNDNDSELKNVINDGESHESSTNARSKRFARVITPETILFLIIIMVLCAGLLLFICLDYRDFPIRSSILGYSLFCILIVAIMERAITNSSRHHFSRRINLVVVIIMLILGFAQIALGWNRFGIRSDKMLRHRKILVLEGTSVIRINEPGMVEVEYPPERFGVTSQDLNRIFLPLWNVDTYSPDYNILWKYLQNKCASDSSMNLRMKLTEEGLIFVAVVDDVAYGHWSVIFAIGGLFCILFSEWLLLNTLKSTRQTKF